jgi:hypothetical protein
VAAVHAQRREHAARAQAAGMRAALGSGLPAPIWAKRLAGALHPLTGQRMVETAALTSMGRVAPLDLGEGLLSDRCWIDGPVRMPKGLFICPCLHEGQLNVGLRSSRAQLGRDALRRIGETYLVSLRELGGVL